MVRRHASPLAAVALAVLALGLAAPARAAHEDVGDPDGPGPLPWRVTGRVGFTVDAAAFPDSTGHTLEVYLRVAPVTLAKLQRDTLGVGRLKLTMRLTNRFGGRPQERTQEFAIAPGDTAYGFGKVVIMKFPTRPGVSRLRVRLEDLMSRKRGLGYLGRKVTESSTVEGEIEVPAPQAGRDLSDLEFLWARTETDVAPAFRRGEHVAIPNPERLYGLLANEVRADFTARGPAGDSRPWRWHARVLDAGGRVVAEQRDTASAGQRLSATVSLDMASEPAGGYDLEVKAWQEGDPGALIRTAHFSVGWLPGSWLIDPSEADDAVHFLLSAEEEARFGHLHVGEREQFLEEFWRRRDPTPDTAENEARLEFQARIDHSNKNFDAPGTDKGMFSDMGRTYIRYGEPDEVLKQVIPAGDATLERVLQDLELSEDRPTGDVHQKGLGGDQRAYEVWLYESLAGTTPDTDPAHAVRLRSRRRMVFLFVDEHGYGNFTLRYSTE